MAPINVAESVTGAPMAALNADSKVVMPVVLLVMVIGSLVQMLVAALLLASPE